MNDWIIENLGEVLIHSLWQIGFIALILFLALRVLQNASANLRYLLSILALCLSLILPVATFVYLSNDSKTINSVKEQSSIPTKSEPIFQNSESRIIPQNSPVPAINSTKTNYLSSSLKFPLFPALVILWLIGVIGFSIRLLGGIWTVHTYKTRNILPVSKKWHDTFDELCKNLQIKQKVRFLQSKTIEMPVVIGWLKPVILIPVSAFLQIPPKELETVLMHELIHLSRRDYLVNLIQSLVEILFFYHPGVWWISGQIRKEREFAVDEFVSQIFDRERFIYAKALASLEEIRPASNQFTPALAMAGTGGNLMERIEKILQGNRKLNSKNISIWSAVFAMTFVVGITAGLYWLKTSEFKKSKNGRKVAVVFSNLSFQNQEIGLYENIFELQQKYEIPAAWNLEPQLINELQQSGKATDFFRQGQANQSDFIIDIPNINSTIFMNGDDKFIESWRNQVQFVDQNLAQLGGKLKYFSKSGYSPQMENYLVNSGLNFIQLSKLNAGLKFHIYYQKDCVRSENGLDCRDRSIEQQKEIREKYLQYMTETLEVNERFSEEQFGHRVPQILYLGTGKLTNDSADEILKILKDRGYEFVPLEEAISDEGNKIQNPSLEHKNFLINNWKIENKYLNQYLPADNRKPVKNYKIEVKTKDFKIIEK